MMENDPRVSEKMPQFTWSLSAHAATNPLSLSVIRSVAANDSPVEIATETQSSRKVDRLFRSGFA
jgi:hypothetical protein